MVQPKTTATQADPADYIAAIAIETRRRDCEQLLALMSKVTQQAPVLWGPSIVGFGVHRYTLASGKQGEICAVGFAPRKSDISIYGLVDQTSCKELLGTLGKYKLGKGCLYVNRLADIDLNVLQRLVGHAFQAKHDAV